MKKSEIKGILTLAVIGLTIYPFITLYETFGVWGLIVPLILVIVFITHRNVTDKKKEQHAFDDMVLSVLHGELRGPEAGRIVSRLSKTNFPRSSLVRNVQIISESIYIALKSKKQEIAKSRMEGALELFYEIESEQSHLISDDTFKEITATVKDAEEKLHTLLYINLASAHLEKVEKLKTKKSKEKYINLAKDALHEGLADKLSDKNKIQQILNNALEIEQTLST